MKSKVKQLSVIIGAVKKIKPQICEIAFACDYLAGAAVPGNFIHIKVKDVILRRPLSIHKIEAKKVFILFKVKGRGTRSLAKYKKGDRLDVIGPLGQGFKVSYRQPAVSCQNILIAGGIGVAPLVFLAGKLSKMQSAKQKAENIILLGGKNKVEIVCEKEFKRLGFKVHTATEDGSKGFKGNVVGLLKTILQTTNNKLQTTIYACGPEPMFKALSALVKQYSGVNCQVSFEQFMGCGIGTCCACTIQTKNGYKKVCTDGPVFDIKDIW